MSAAALGLCPGATGQRAECESYTRTETNLWRHGARYRHTLLLERYATGAPEHDENADGSNMSSSRFQASTITRIFSLSYLPHRESVLYDLDLDAYVVHAPSESDDRSEAEDAS